MTDSVLFQAVIYLAAAVVGVPLAKRLGLGSVLGYLLAGVAIGPFGLRLVGHEGSHVMHFAEFGVVMMLFLVGLELKPSLLWQLRRPIFGLGGAQVVVTTVVVGALGFAVGVDWRISTAVGMTLAMSSTAIVLSSLNERGLLKSPGGQSAFSVLLFQDVSVIPILAVFPLLAVAAAATQTDPNARPGWQQALLVLGAVAAVVVAGRYVVRPVLRKVAETELRELFTAFALFLVVGIALLMQKVGLSPALGTFLAGVVLADSEYRHELESDIEPFKGLLLGLFFISVGADINFGLMVQSPVLIAGLVFGVMVVKFVVLMAIAPLFGVDRPARWLLALSLCQIGEFAFVLFSFGAQTGVIPESVGAPLVASTALTMLLTPLLFVLLERVVLPRVTATGPKREHDHIEHGDNPVVLAGFGRVGQVIGRLLRLNGFGVTVLDLDSDIVDVLRRLGQQVYYGDASRLDLLTSAGCAKAKLFVLAIDDVDKSLEVGELVKRHYPKLPILARARNRTHYYRLLQLGVPPTHIFRETMGSSLEMAVRALVDLGVRAHTAQRRMLRWKEHDEAALEKMAAAVGTASWMDLARKILAEAEKSMENEFQGKTDSREHDAAWDNEPLREGVKAAAAAQQAAAQAAAAKEAPKS
jgi:monovalent cation:proton antiporter-2 (CPA2) family protein